MCIYLNLQFFSTIGTHDIQNVTVDSSQIRVRGDFIDQSTATGALVMIYSLNNDTDVYYIEVDKGTEQYIDVNVTDLTGTEYGVSVFTMENHRLPFPRIVTLPEIVNVASHENQGLHA